MQFEIPAMLSLPGFLRQALMTVSLLKTSLHSHLTYEYVSTNLALMYDCVGELASLFLLLQSITIIGIEAHNRVLLTKQAMKSLKSRYAFYERQIPRKFSGI